MDIDLGILKNIFTKKEDIRNNLTSTDTDKPLSAAQGKALDENKIDLDDIEMEEATITYEDGTTETKNIVTYKRNE